MNTKLVLMLAAAALPLGGCLLNDSGPVVSNVAVFHTLDQVPANATFSVVPWRADLERSLEFRSYALRLTEIIDDAGYRTVSPGQPADYIVYLDYGIDDGTYYEYTYNAPVWGTVSDGEQVTTTVTETPSGQVITQTSKPTNPRIGQTGTTVEVARGTTFERFVNVDIVSRSTGAGDDPVPVYELRLKSAGSCGSIPTLMPRFMKAIEKRFDAKSGKAGRVKAGDIKC